MTRSNKSVDEVARKQWCAELAALCQRHNGNQWAIGDLYNRGRQVFGGGWCHQVTDTPEWRQAATLDYDTLKTYAYVARRFPVQLRYLNCTFTSHHEAAILRTAEQRMELMADVARYGWSTNRVRIEARLRKRAAPQNDTNIVSDLQSVIAGGILFRGVLADVPWPWDNRPGKRGSSDGHYPSMPFDAICALPVPQITTNDSMLFIWCSPANLVRYGLPLLHAWGYEYETHGCWDKQVMGVGSYWRMENEDILLGVRPATQGHFDDSSIGSMIRQKRSRRHSEKPPIHSMIQRAIGGPYIELFGRAKVQGWTVFGNQLSLEATDTDNQLLAAE